MVLARAASSDAAEWTPLDPLTATPVGPAQAKDRFTALPRAMPENRALQQALAVLDLTDPDPAKRLTAVQRTGQAGGEANRLLLTGLLGGEADAKVQRRIVEGIALIDLAAASPASRAAACTQLGRLASAPALDPLRRLSGEDPDPAVRSAAAAAIDAIASWQQTVSVAQIGFSGLSAGSILIIMALGLSITFGLMGVINMAHGEMLMIGAYATLCVQWIFAQALPPALMPYYFPLGLLAGFVAAGAVGLVLERTIIRHLYGRPLETLLATWGISWLLVQSVRAGFGESNSVIAPAWLSGSWEPMQDLALPINRLFIIAVTVASVILVWWLLARTRLGLLLRATVQSRRTAAALGVETGRIDGLTFAFGSGLAGAAGCALTLIGGIKPDMGQSYIVDSFLTVAVGGVGNLWGVVCAGLGLGMLNKVLEPMTNAVFAKILVLCTIIAYLQARPQGFFPPRGRLNDG